MQQKSRKLSPLHHVFMATRETIRRTIAKIVPPKEIEDIVQETYVRMCQLENADKIEKPKSFLMQTAKNIAFDYLKKSETRLADSAEHELDFDVDSDANDDVYQHAATDQEFARFCEAVRDLPVQCRRAFVLKKVYGYTQKEISKEMGISQSTVEKHIALGLRRCSSYMKKMHTLYINEKSKSGKYSSIASTLGGKK